MDEPRYRVWLELEILDPTGDEEDEAENFNQFADYGFTFDTISQAEVFLEDLKPAAIAIADGFTDPHDTA